MAVCNKSTRYKSMSLQCRMRLPFVLQLENYIQDSMKQDIVQIQQTAVHNHTATMIEIGTNLLSQTAEQTRKLTNVEAQVRLLYHYLNIRRV